MSLPCFCRGLLFAACLLLGISGSSGQSKPDTLKSYSSASDLSGDLLAVNTASGFDSQTAQPLSLQSNGMNGLYPASESPYSSDWQLEVRPYAWILGVEGFIERNHRVGSDYDLGIGDVVDTLDELEVMVPISLEARKGRVSFLVDVFYAKWDGLTTGDLGLTSPVPGLDLDLTWEELLVQYGMGYTLFEGCTPGGRQMRLDVQGGGRYLYISGNGAIAGPNDRFEIGLDGSENFSEPWVGGRLDVNLCNRTSLRLGGDVGGFGTGDSVGTNWQAYALLQYQVSPNVTLDAGYRHLELEFEDGFKGGLLAFKQEASGPIVGLTYRF
jgi:opacity protein-like surface antigen